MQAQFTQSPYRKQAGTPIYSGRHVVGHVRGGTFYKSVSASRHFLRKPAAIAFDLSTLKDAEQAGAVRVEVYDRDTGSTYTASMALIRLYGFLMNRGFGEQLALVLEKWTVRRKGAPVQNTLFEEE